MAYFTQAFNQFFKNLAKNNSKEWFHTHKKTYLKEVKNPFYNFLEDLIARIQQQYDPDLFLEVKNAVFRINRDIRFSKDKTLYKLQVGAVIARGGRKNSQIPGLYVQFGVGEIWIGGGLYSPDKNSLHQVRRHITDHPERFNHLLESVAFRNVYGKLLGQQHKRIPKEFKAAFVQQPLIANKQFYFMSAYDDESLISREDLLEWVLEHYRAGLAMNQFLMEAVLQTSE
jgi:uncharacterized protein (TIGR02453 family)